MRFTPWWPLVVVSIAALVGTVLLWRTGRFATTTTTRRIVIAVLVGLCALRPITGSAEAGGRTSNVDVVLLVDRTTSMAAEDYDGSRRRIEGVRADIRRITEDFAGSRFSLVTFDAQGRIEMPFTTDSTALVTMADVIDVQRSYYSRGSSIDAGLEVTRDMLAKAKEQYPNRRTYLFYLSDGEQTAAQLPGSFDELKPLVDGGAVFGYGTPGGGRMRVSDESELYISDGGEDALSKIDENNLKRVAEQAGIGYQHRTGDASIGIKPKSGSSSIDGGRTATGNELTWIPALLLMGLLGWESWVSASAARSTRRTLFGGGPR